MMSPSPSEESLSDLVEAASAAGKASSSSSRAAAGGVDASTPLTEAVGGSLRRSPVKKKLKGPPQQPRSSAEKEEEHRPKKRWRWPSSSFSSSAAAAAGAAAEASPSSEPSTAAAAAAAAAAPLPPLAPPPSSSSSFRTRLSSLKQTSRSDWRRWYATAMFTVVAALLSADQNLMAPSLSAIAAEFGMSAEDKDRLLGGYISAIFFAVGAPAALAAGYLADRVHRPALMALVVALGEAPCLFTPLVRGYGGLLAVRTLTGLAVGGVPPLLYSLVGDLWPPRHRAKATAAVQVALGAGLALGQVVAGFLGPLWGWRAPFVVVAAPSVGVAVLMLLTCPDPPRGGAEDAVVEVLEVEAERAAAEEGEGGGGGGGGDEQRTRVAGGGAAATAATAPAAAAAAAAAAPAPPSSAPAPAAARPHTHRHHTHRHHNHQAHLVASASELHLAAPGGLAGVVAAARVLAVPSGAAAILQGLPGSIPWGVVMVFMVDYLHAQQGLSVQFAASIGLAWGIGGAPGVLGGGWLGQSLHDRVGPGAMPAATGAAVALSTPPALFLVLGDVAAAPRSVVLILAFLGGMLASCSGPNCRCEFLSLLLLSLSLFGGDPSSFAFALASICCALTRVSPSALLSHEQQQQQRVNNNNASTTTRQQQRLNNNNASTTTTTTTRQQQQRLNNNNASTIQSPQRRPAQRHRPHQPRHGPRSADRARRRRPRRGALRRRAGRGALREAGYVRVVDARVGALRAGVCAWRVHAQGRRACDAGEAAEEGARGGGRGRGGRRRRREEWRRRRCCCRCRRRRRRRRLLQKRWSSNSSSNASSSNASNNASSSNGACRAFFAFLKKDKDEIHFFLCIHFFARHFPVLASFFSASCSSVLCFFFAAHSVSIRRTKMPSKG